MGKGTNLTEEDMYLAAKHMKTHSVSLVITKMQIKTAITRIRMTKSSDNTKCWRR